MAASYIPFNFESGSYRAKVRCSYLDGYSSTKYKDSGRYTFEAASHRTDRYSYLKHCTELIEAHTSDCHTECWSPFVTQSYGYQTWYTNFTTIKDDNYDYYTINFGNATIIRSDYSIAEYNFIGDIVSVDDNYDYGFEYTFSNNNAIASITGNELASTIIDNPYFSLLTSEYSTTYTQRQYGASTSGGNVYIYNGSLSSSYSDVEPRVISKTSYYDEYANSGYQYTTYGTRSASSSYTLNTQNKRLTYLRLTQRGTLNNYEYVYTNYYEMSNIEQTQHVTWDYNEYGNDGNETIIMN